MSENYEVKYTLFDSLAEMLSPDTLSNLLGYSVSDVTCRPFENTNGFSGNQLFYVEADMHKLVLKRMRQAVDWISICTNDHRCRSIRIWQYGLLDLIRPHMQHAILAASRDADDFAILMQDVSDGLISNGQEITPQMVYPMLDALARMHAIFWEDEKLKAVELGLNDIQAIIPFGWPTQWDRYPHAREIVALMKQGWEVLFELVEPDVRQALQWIMDDPQPLYDTLAKYPSTLIHSDYRLDNLAWMADARDLVVFDWQFAGYAPATVCMCWFVMSGGLFDKQWEYVEYYRQRLSNYLGDHFDPGLWQPLLELGCLVDVLRKGNWHAYFSVTGEDEAYKAHMRKSVDSYNDLVRKGLEWI
jgi:hypothetical protein